MADEKKELTYAEFMASKNRKTPINGGAPGLVFCPEDMSKLEETKARPPTSEKSVTWYTCTKCSYCYAVEL